LKKYGGNNTPIIGSLLNLPYFFVISMKWFQAATPAGLEPTALGETTIWQANCVNSIFALRNNKNKRL
jgi:hypothetical protein